MHINRHITPSHRGFKLLCEIGRRGPLGPIQLAEKADMRVSRAKKELKNLESLGLVTTFEAIILHERPYALTDSGKIALRKISDWHTQDWLTRTFGPPPPSI